MTPTHAPACARASTQQSPPHNRCFNVIYLDHFHAASLAREHTHPGTCYAETLREIGDEFAVRSAVDRWRRHPHLECTIMLSDYFSSRRPRLDTNPDADGVLSLLNQSRLPPSCRRRRTVHVFDRGIRHSFQTA